MHREEGQPDRRERAGSKANTQTDRICLHARTNAFTLRQAGVKAYGRRHTHRHTNDRWKGHRFAFVVFCTRKQERDSSEFIEPICKFPINSNNWCVCYTSTNATIRTSMLFPWQPLFCGRHSFPIGVDLLLSFHGNARTANRETTVVQRRMLHLQHLPHLQHLQQDQHRKSTSSLERRLMTETPRLQHPSAGYTHLGSIYPSDAVGSTDPLPPSPPRSRRLRH